MALIQELLMPQLFLRASTPPFDRRQQALYSRQLKRICSVFHLQLSKMSTPYIKEIRFAHFPHISDPTFLF